MLEYILPHQQNNCGEWGQTEPQGKHFWNSLPEETTPPKEGGSEGDVGSIGRLYRQLPMRLCLPPLARYCFTATFYTPWVTLMINTPQAAFFVLHIYI